GQGADRGAALRGGARGRVPRERDAAPGPEGGLAHPGTTRAARIERAGGAVTQVLVAVATYEAVVRTGADGKDPGWQQNHTGQDDSYRLTRTRYLHASQVLQRCAAVRPCLHHLPEPSHLNSRRPVYGRVFLVVSLHRSRIPLRARRERQELEGAVR